MKIVKTILNPFWIIVLYVSVFLLYLFLLAKHYNTPSAITILYFLFSILSFWTGLDIAKRLKVKRKKTNQHYKSKALSILWAAYGISIVFLLIEYIHFYYHHGTIPIFSQNVEYLRFEFGINGYTHLIAMLNYILLYSIWVDYYYFKKHKLNAYTLLLVASFIISISLTLGIGHRGIIILFLAYTYFSTRINKNFSIKRTLIISFVVVYFLGWAKYKRDVLQYGIAVNETIKSDWKFSEVEATYPLYYSYLTVTSGFFVLDRYVKELPHYFWGYFTIAQPIVSLLPGKQYDMLELQNDVLNKEHHGVLTATILGSPYFDWGISGGIIFMFFIGFVLGRYYKKILIAPNINSIIPYSYLYILVVLGIYTYSFNKLYIILNIFILVVVSNLVYFPKDEISSVKKEQ